MSTHAKTDRIFIGRLDKGDDLYDALTELCKEEHITAGTFTIIGAVGQACLGYYDQKKKNYRAPLLLKKHLELVSCSGNISLKDGFPFVHAHIVLADERGRAFGGHLMAGTTVFAAEYFIQELKGISLVRHPDPATGLTLWQK